VKLRCVYVEAIDHKLVAYDTRHEDATEVMVNDEQWRDIEHIILNDQDMSTDIYRLGYRIPFTIRMED